MLQARGRQDNQTGKAGAMSVIEAMKTANPAVTRGDMALISEVKRILGAAADQMILEALRARQIWIHGYDRPHMLTPEQRAADLLEADGRFFNCLTIR